MMQKECTNCKEVKSIDDFSKDINRKDGIDLWCKKCKNKYKKNHYHTKEGLATQIFVHQRYKSKKINYPLPSYSKDELKNWLFNNEKFSQLFSEWENSGFAKNYSPSIDRLDDYLPYSLDNIRLVKWIDNKTKFHNDEKLGINRKKLVPVVGVCKNTGKVIEFYSIAEAHRVTNASQCHIINICKKKKNYRFSAGYSWYYKNDYIRQNEY